MTTADRNNLLPLIMGGVLISFSGPLAKIASTGPTVTAFYRMLFGGLILCAIVLPQGGFRRIDRTVLLWSAVSGIVFGLDLTFWHRSIRYVGPGLATIAANFQVFLLAIFGAVFARERVGLRLGLGIPLAVIGLILVVYQDWHSGIPNYRLGVAFGLITAVCYTTYTLSLRRLQRNRDRVSSMTNIALLSLISAVFLGIEGAIQGESLMIPNLSTAGILTIYGIIGQVLAWVLISQALPHTRVALVGLILLLQPLLSFLWDILFFHRTTSMIEAVGAVVALAAIYLGATSVRT